MFPNCKLLSPTYEVLSFLSATQQTTAVGLYSVDVHLRAGIQYTGSAWLKRRLPNENCNFPKIIISLRKFLQLFTRVIHITEFKKHGNKQPRAVTLSWQVRKLGGKSPGGGCPNPRAPI